MATIKASCPVCGVIRLGVVEVRVVVDDDSNHVYRFDCPQCASPVVHPTTPAIGALLRSVGVEAVRMPSNVLGADQRPSEPGSGRAAFTADDVTDFQHALQREDWFDQFLATTRTEGDPNR